MLNKLREIWNNLLGLLSQLLVIAIIIFYAYSTCSVREFQEDSLIILTFIVGAIIFAFGKYFINLIRKRNFDGELIENIEVNKLINLNPVLAESIVRNYGGSLAIDNNNNSIARPISYLKNSIFEIENAFKFYIIHLKNQKKFDKEIEEKLLVIYTRIDCFVDDGVIKKIQEIESFKKMNTNQYKDSNQYTEDMQFIMKINLEIIEKNMKRSVAFYQI